MSKKKILWIILLVVVIIAIIVGIINARPIKSTENNTTDSNKSLGNVEKSNMIEDTKTEQSKQYQKTELSDGILYSLDGEKIEADLVIGDNYYDTTITDIYLNPQNYFNKKIEIEGMYLVSDLSTEYTFVGRYSLSNLCPSCPVGYSVVEYQLDGIIDRELVDEQDWIKIIGTLEKGNDASSNYQDYYYLKALNLEIMNERGQDTVNN